MTITQSRFPGFEGQRLRDEGIKRVEANGKEWLRRARDMAMALLERPGFFPDGITADDVRVYCPLPAGLHVNTWGALFKDPRFVPVGDAQTTHKAGHARRVRRWGLKGDGR